MKVLLSIDALKYPLTGIGRYTYELATGLERQQLASLKFSRYGEVLDTIPSMTAESGAGGPATQRSQAFLARARSKLRQLPGIPTLHAAYRNWRQGQLKGLCADHLFHGPNYAVPDRSGPSVVTIHDLSVYALADFHPADRVCQLQRQIEQALGRASAIITDTHHTRQEFIAHFGLPEERVHAVHLASSGDFYPRTDGELAPTLAGLDLVPGGYSLFVGTIEPRKNLGTLLDAYEALPTGVRRRWPLVVAGDQGWHSATLHRRFERAQNEGWLKYLGFAPQDLLVFLVAGARLFAFPSLYEGFGLPVLEAAACGVPVVCSNASCLPEVGGSAFAYHDPEDRDHLCQLLEQGLCDPQWRASAREAGLRRAQEFSWKRCVEETLSVYKSIA